MIESKPIRFCLMVAGCILFPPAFVVDVQGAAEIPVHGEPVPELAAFDAAMAKSMRANGVKGGALVVMKDGRIVLKHGYGWSDQAQTVPFDPNARVRVASISKSFTAAGIKTLIRNGSIESSTTVVPYLGIEPKTGRWGDARWQLVNVQHLLSHSGGLDSREAPTPSVFRVSTSLGLDHAATASELLAFEVTLPLQFAPGSRFAYSGIGYSFLGRVIERATGLDYLSFIRRRIARPWGIRNIELARTSPRLRASDEPWYDDAGAGPPDRDLANFPTEQKVPLPDGGELLYESADSGGGLMMNLEALVTFSQAYLYSHGTAFPPAPGLPIARNGDPRQFRHLAQTGAQLGGVAGASLLNFQSTNGVDFAFFFNRTLDAGSYPWLSLKNIADTTTVWPGDSSTCISLATDSFSVREDEGMLIVGVRRTGESHGAVSAEFRLEEGNARDGLDFNNVTGTIRFEDDEIARTISIPIVNNPQVHGERHFSIRLQDPQGGAKLGIAKADVVIEDMDGEETPPLVEVSIGGLGYFFDTPFTNNVFVPGTALVIQPKVQEGTRKISKVEYFAGETLLDEENKPPYAFVWEKPAAGFYSVSIRAVDDRGHAGWYSPIILCISTNAPLLSGLLREVWTRRPGPDLSNLTNYAYFPEQPTGWQFLDQFEAPADWGDYYGARLRGYIVPPLTGDYIFWLAADEHAEFWLSPDEAEDRKALILSLGSPTKAREWDKFASQKSAPVRLEANRRYYVEALHKEATGDDHLAIGWQLPSGGLERPIPGLRLQPYEPGKLQLDRSRDGVDLTLAGLPGKSWRIEGSTNLTHWLPLDDVSISRRPFRFEGFDSAARPRWFYRAQQLHPHSSALGNSQSRN